MKRYCFRFEITVETLLDTVVDIIKLYIKKFEINKSDAGGRVSDLISKI